MGDFEVQDPTSFFQISGNVKRKARSQFSFGFFFLRGAAVPLPIGLSRWLDFWIGKIIMDSYMSMVASH
ncbi:hypothetical protein SODALDRAFT_357555 [Sodiomyces alkalinus F11]|uniref:Uncharacterized protein n=1 Tax=Sodiomyces alkalinus (strain CBS 110278 / VKM F-3762 / F11) TaxID=1314773 RepID=A0A3N2Q417_SODAK|nr:hypothetical protein SODALDRAFT_357555 [Sodiomyces alkalinus F11]ROT41503.1 hypothetical protein SODALDRAFT_357555 [Sodiomyces alkalinus F11]